MMIPKTTAWFRLVNNLGHPMTGRSLVERFAPRGVLNFESKGGLGAVDL